MRRVDRTLVLEPAILQKKGPGEIEKYTAGLRRKRAQALSRKTGKTKKEKAFEFKVYKEEEVKEALQRLFLGKCAYCESRYAGTQPVDVEHWRPKGKIVEVDENGKVVREIEPGYYWLAASWDNLLPSCIDCNRRREHSFELSGTKRAMGKGNLFPLAAGSQRATEDQPDVSIEQPLLLNPCLEDPPEEYLDFDPDLAEVRPKADPGRRDKAQTSILVYGLNRNELVQERKEVLLLIKQRMYTIERLVWLLDDPKLGAKSTEIVEDLLSHELDGLRRFCEPDRPYTLMARQVIGRFLHNLTGEPVDLLGGDSSG